MNQKPVLIAAAVLSMHCSTAHAQNADRQDLSAVQRTVDQYLNVQTTGLPGKVSYTVGTLDPRTALPACPSLEAFTPSGARLWGATNVGVRCNGATPWTVYVTAQVKVVGEYLVTSRPLSQGQVLTDTDFTAMQGDLTQLPVNTLTSAQQAAGKTLMANLAPGLPLRQDVLRSPLIVQQGQSVKLQTSGNGFTVSADGKALNNAQEGQVVQVRTTSGQTVSGVARATGIIEVRF